MVHKKYIKRDGKTFGPYLYENYREKGVTKTRYLGKTSEKKVEKGFKNVKKSVKKNKVFFIFLGIVLLFLIFTFFGLFFLENSKLNLGGELASENLDVFVTIFSNDPPEILNITNEIYVCENTFLSYIFNVIDPDKVVDSSGNLIVSVDISDKDPFYITSSVLDDYTIESEIFSFGDLDKTHVEAKRHFNDAWAVYPETITASDGFLSDAVNTEIIVLEVNNPPAFNLGAQTLDLYTKGENSTFYYDLGAFLLANNEETPTSDLIFNLDFLSAVPPFFGINNQGIINFTGNDIYILPGQNFTTYHLNLSVQDTGLIDLRENMHPNMSLCYSYGLSEDAQLWAQDFYLTITKENRAPNITSYYPDLSLNVLGTDVLYFNMTAKDPDYTPLDVYWYVDSVEQAHISGFNSTDLSEFEYIFGCNLFGKHKVEVVVTDGLLNDSLQWNISLEEVPCPISLPGAPGGGSGGFFCKEKWGCEEWNQCENVLKGIVSNELTKEYELLIKGRCDVFNYTEDNCGFQTRNCSDANRCTTEESKPGIIRECYFTENPECTDGIKNCHNGACEVLIDCGGPCIPCKTCSDGIKNQGEEKIDCGGPCKSCIEIPFTSLFFKSIISYSLIALLILILFLIYKQFKKYKAFKKIEIETPKKTLQTLKNIGGEHTPKFIFILFVVILLFLANTFIINFAQTGSFLPSPEDVDFLASYGFINNFIKNLPILFFTGPIINGNTRLEIWDDSDSLFEQRYSICNQYCAQKSKPSPELWMVYFYANYTDNTNYLPLLTGTCDIAFQDSQGVYGGVSSMTYNSSSGLFEYVRTFDYKGNYDFNINCTDGALLVAGEDDFTITNTEPYIIRTAAGYVDIDADGQKEAWQCFEDSVCYYYFASNVSEDDVNDVLIYDYLSNANTTLTDFILNSSTGILEINITHSDDTGSGVNAKKIELSVQDSERTVSAILEVDVGEVNDAPVFVNLQDKDLSSGELFLYTIQVSDEEDDFPFTFLVDFIDCDPATRAARGNCNLFTSGDYVVDGLNGFLDINFIPQSIDIGNYIVNFSVIDNSSLGNKRTSQVVNFTVQVALWNASSNYDYSLIEDQSHPSFPLDLNTKIINEIPPVIFYNETSFPSFSLTSNGIIDFIPTDVDVGNYYFKVIAEDSLAKPSFKFFNFTTNNVNDAPKISDIQAQGVISVNPSNYNINAFENANIKIFLFVDDDDFLIPATQKSFYDENLSIDLTIIGPNTSIFNFVFDAINGNQAKYDAVFTPRAGDVGTYEIIVNITDNSSVSDILSFNLTIFSRNYDMPQILYPDVLTEFNLFENISSNLIFRANHTVGDNLTYMFYIDGILKQQVNYYGDARDLNWNFVPNFTEETYNQKKNLTLIVLNPYFSDLNISRTWNLTINHTNAPVEFIRDIGDKRGISLDYSLFIDLKNHFSDVDYFDTYYNQSVNFNIVGDMGVVFVSGVSQNWTFSLSSPAPIIESFNITAYDMNLINNTISLTNITSNSFIVEFVPPTTVPVPVPTPVSRTKTVPLSIKIIMPGKISAYEGEKMDIPLTLVNTGSRTFNGLELNSSAFKDGDISNEIKTSLDKTSFNKLDTGDEENLTLSVFFDTDKLGDYEILVNVMSKSPSYKDWGKIHVNLQAINESTTRELILFTQEFIAQNPQCIEIKEIVNEAQKYFDLGDYSSAREKTEQAINSCEESISQVSLPKLRIEDFKSWYLVLAIVLSFVIGLIYYFFKRSRLKSLRTAVPSTALLGQHKKI